MLDNFSSYGASNHLSEVLDYVQHWRDRVSNEEVRVQGQTLSTVGIDINELIFDCGSKGTVTFRTWDFGGQVSGEWRIHCSPADQLQYLLRYFQCECYTTHQYFLLVTVSFAVLFSVNAIQHPKMSYAFQCEYCSTHRYFLSLTMSSAVLFSLSTNSPVLPDSYNVFCSTLQREYLLTSTSCQFQYLLGYFSA